MFSFIVFSISQGSSLKMGPDFGALPTLFTTTVCRPLSSSWLKSVVYERSSGSNLILTFGLVYFILACASSSLLKEREIKVRLKPAYAS